MLAQRQRLFQQHSFDHEADLSPSYGPLDMSHFGCVDSTAQYASLPFSYYENPALFVEAPLDEFHYEMNRSVSNGSAHRASNPSSEFIPALFSAAPSIPSASSSTVGSPYSGHSHPISTTDSWSSPGLAIVGHDGFVNEFVGAGLDAELAFAGSGKLPGNFVGECADLSSPQRLSTFPFTAAAYVKASSPLHQAFSASPEPLNGESFDRVATAPPLSTKYLDASWTPTEKKRSSSSKSEPIFKSPTTPASARGRTSTATSPVARRNTGGIPPSPAPPASPSFHQGAHPPHQRSRHFHTHFFAQSSDPSLIQGPRPSYPEPTAFGDYNLYHNQPPAFQTAMSPVGSPAASPPHFNPHPSQQYSPVPQYPNYSRPSPFLGRRPSFASVHSGQSHQSPVSSDFDDDTKEKGRCPHPECGRVFKDLKAHMLTHQSERPEKCPILHCEYNQKGFARKYDKNRHTLTHYKGTMVCGFCPGSGSAAEKSFNRADVFKRHLTSVHGVEQTPPNSRKRSPTSSNKKLSSYCQDATGKCSTCSATFTNAQDFYEHLDDCVLRVVQQEEDSEAVNAMRLSEVAADEDVKETLERHMLSTEETFAALPEEDDEDEDEDDEDEDEDEHYLAFPARPGRGLTRQKSGTTAHPVLGPAGVAKKTRKGPGLTYSKGGVPLLSAVSKSRKKRFRKNYPPSWGMAPEKMGMKKRVLCVYDGQRRLWKDDLMMHNEFEVRMRLPGGDGKSYVTDLDVETLKRSQAIHGATPEERGPWIPEQHGQQMSFGGEVDIEALMS